MSTRPSPAFALALAALFACGGSPAPAAQPRPAAAAPAPVADAPVILALGDSLTAGLGVAQSQAWPSLLQTRLAAAGHRHRVVNAGVSGDTSAGGLARLDWQLAQRPAIVVLELGANDGLRGLPVAHTRDNLDKIITRCKAAGAQVVLAGMQVPPNMGPGYADEFKQMFADLATTHDIRRIEFLLAGVAGDVALNQADGIHPTAAGHAIMAETVWDALRPLLPAPPA